MTKSPPICSKGQVFTFVPYYSLVRFKSHPIFPLFMVTPPEDVVREVKALEQLIRSYSEERVGAWRQLPYWALKATTPDARQQEIIDNFEIDDLFDERPAGVEYAGLYRRIRAFKYGVWAVEAAVTQGIYSMLVDCASGKLIDSNYFFPQQRIEPASQSQVLRIGAKVRELEPLNILKLFKDKAARAQPLSKEINDWQEGMIIVNVLDRYGFKRRS